MFHGAMSTRYERTFHVHYICCSNGQAEEVSLSHTKLFRVLRIQLAIMCSSYIRLHHGHVTDPALRFDWICKLCMLQRRVSKNPTTSAQNDDLSQSDCGSREIVWDKVRVQPHALCIWSVQDFVRRTAAARSTKMNSLFRGTGRAEH